MLAIRFQRVGRKGHAEYRVIVQEARRSPSSGRIVAQIGHHNPHTKVTVLDSEKAAFYVGNGAQPSPRVAYLFKSEGVKLPDWVKIDSSKAKSIKNTDKLRRNRPAGTPAPEKPAEEPVALAADEPAEVTEPADSETSVADVETAAKEEVPADEEPAEPESEAEVETPAEETAA